MDSNDSERTSELLSTYLDRHFPGTKEDVDIRRTTQLVMEQAVKFGGTETYLFYGGSRVEGFYLADSDFDMMLIDRNVTVLLSGQCIPTNRARHTSLYMRQGECRPGYVNLLLGQLGQHQSHVLLNSLVPMENRSFVSSDIYREQFVSYMNSDEGHLFESNGPSCTTKSVSFSMDLVPCFPSNGWPRQAHEWITRTRLYGWPHQTLIDRIVRSGCHVVPVGDKCSEDTLLQWRISFISAERKLVHSFSHIQFKVYFLLKYFLKQLKHLLKEVIGDDDILCSYFLKTVLFHAIENSDQNFWQDKNLFNCFWLCFNILIAWVKAGYCPNYFIPANNLFKRKIHGQNQQRLFKILNEYQLLKWGCLPVGKFSRPLLLQYLATLQDNLVQPESVHDAVLRRDKSVVNHLRNLHFPESRSLKTIVGMLNLLSKSESAYAEIISYYYAIHILYEIAIEQVYPDHMNAINNKTSYKSLKKTKYWMIPRASMGTELLYLATFHFKTGNYGKSLEVIRQIMRLASYFSDDTEKLTPEQEVLYTVGDCSPGNPSIQKLRKVFTRSISFTFGQEQFCLPHLQSKLSTQCLHIPPLLYAIFLSFMCCHELGDTNERDRALRYLIVTKYNDLQGGQRHWIVHTLLGICYQTLGDNRRAIRCFEDSAKTEAGFHVFG
ncbi:uncharacterized protein LOC110461323 [Mizuhopecten yessoensis]|uniref:Cyclic GMP-AMP synthase n=1 Tax=Mizuhopecten yessoensis TaxID=6573 RepID=A0A210Q0F4_MIZYE|nr:uncharacterized protein LOC110461323 [Mizuhopecten yessoensis]OWF42233.1 Cyclic GMP-AMP synthase [Mizuhopecten yessoensis]